MRASSLFVGVAALTIFLSLPFCALLHRCGCVAPWLGGEVHCNVHAPSGPHCPWCEHPILGAAALGLTLTAQAGVFASARRRGASLSAAAVASAASLPVAIAGVALLLWLPTDYPHLLVRGARARLGIPSGPVPCHGAQRP